MHVTWKACMDLVIFLAYVQKVPKHDKPAKNLILVHSVYYFLVIAKLSVSSCSFYRSFVHRDMYVSQIVYLPNGRIWWSRIIVISWFFSI